MSCPNCKCESCSPPVNYELLQGQEYPEEFFDIAKKSIEENMRRLREAAVTERVVYDTQERTPDGRYFICPQCARGEAPVDKRNAPSVHVSADGKSVSVCGFSWRAKIAEDARQNLGWMPR